MKLLTAPIQTELLNEAILITGAPRSGTTLLGKLVGSLGGLEYHFEPSMLYMLGSSYASGELPLDVAVKLLTAYLSEDLFLESVHGRKVNMRPGDDSQVLNSMHWAELNGRWQEVTNRADAIEKAQTEGLRLALKMPNMFDSLPLLRAALPGLKLVVSIRNGVDVVRSIIRKGWVSNAGLERDLWPYCARLAGVNVPYWVPPSLYDRWPTMTEASRACLMWSHHAELGLSALAAHPGPIYSVRYESLLAAPRAEIQALAEGLGHPVTLHTSRWLESIRPENVRSQSSRFDFASSTAPDILARFHEINALWGY